MDNLIDELNIRVKLKLAPSKIHGVGVFATRDIEIGEKLYADHMPNVYRLSQGNLSKLFPHVKQQLIERWPLILQGGPFLYPDTPFLTYMNHSNEPNYDAKSDLALTTIQAGDEVTEDYRRIPGWESVFPFIHSDRRT